MDEGCAYQLAAIATTIFIIVVVIYYAISGVLYVINAIIDYFYDIWVQIGQLWQQIIEFFQNLFEGIAPPTLPPIPITFEPTTGLTPLPVPTPAPSYEPIESPTTEPLLCGIFIREGRAIVYNTQGRGLRCRADHSIDADILAGLADGTEVILKDGPVNQDDFEWWQIEASNVEWCWVAGDWLCPLDTMSPMPASPTPPIPLPPPTPVPTLLPTATPPFNYLTTITPPYDDCNVRTIYSLNPPQGDELLLSEGFGWATGGCNANTGTFTYTLQTFGSKEGKYSPEPPPDQDAYVESITIIEFEPQFTGDLLVEANLTVNGKASAMAGSAFILNLEADEVILEALIEWLTIPHLLTLKTLLEEYSHITAATVETETFLQVLGEASELLGKSNIPIKPDLVASGPLPLPGTLYQKATYDEVIQLSTVVQVTEGQHVRILVGTGSRVQSWGWASSVAKFDIPTTGSRVNSVVLMQR